jgi:hypothetical protein
VFQTDFEVVVLGSRMLVGGEESERSRMMFRRFNGWWLVRYHYSRFRNKFVGELRKVLTNFFNGLRLLMVIVSELGRFERTCWEEVGRYHDGSMLARLHAYSFQSQ